MSGNGFIGWVKEQLDAREEKPLDELWRILNVKELPPMTDRDGLRFRNLIRECMGKEPLRDTTDPKQKSAAIERERVYNSDWKARKKAEKQAQLQ